MSWTKQELTRGTYYKLRVDDFAQKYPGVLDDREIFTIKRMQAILETLETSEYQDLLPSNLATRADELTRTFLERVLRPMVQYDPKLSKPFGGKYDVESFVKVIYMGYDAVYQDLAPSVALLRSELLDINVLEKIPNADLGAAIEASNKQADEFTKATKKFPSIIRKIENAEEAADEWISKQNQVLEKLVATKSRELDGAATRHGTAIQALWVVLAGGLATVAFFMGYSVFITITRDPSVNINTGYALLKFSVIITPLIGSYVCFSQYAYHRSLYDALRFRALALANLATLSKQYPDSKNLIFEKAIDLIFDEPRAKQPNVKISDITDLVKTVRQ